MTKDEAKDILQGMRLAPYLIADAETNSKRRERYSKEIEALTMGMNALSEPFVQHGYWIADNTRPKSILYRCSVCREIAHDRPYGSLKREPKKTCKMKYCPHCGAKMDYNTDWREENETYH